MDLFSSARFGALQLPNRIVMAPLTRLRAEADGTPTALIAEHYAQRAGFGFLVTEGTFISSASKGFMGQPGIVTDAHEAGWSRVAEAVHAEGGRLSMQIMHAGRVTHPDITGVADIEAPSAVAIQGETRTAFGKAAFPVPHALELDELSRVVEEFVAAAERAVRAGLDAVEVHVANGYLLHEFLSPASNTRTDAYGGSPENRARFVVEVVTAVAAAVGADRVGVRISPERNIQDVVETDRADVTAVYTALAAAFAPLGLAYLSVLHPEPTGELVQGIHSAFGGPIVVNTAWAEAISREDAMALVADGFTDAVAVGRSAIANPDLPARWAAEAAENALDAATLYTPGPRGYTDYPILTA